MALGGVSLFVSILNTMGSYFGWARLSEAHRISAIHYSKLYRFISVEMSLPREERTPPAEFLKYCKEQYDRLSEISPLLPELVIKEFKEKFSKESLQNISVPEQMNGLEAISIYGEHDLETDLEIGLKTKKISKTYAKQNDSLSVAGSALNSPVNTPHFSSEATAGATGATAGAASKFVFPQPKGTTKLTFPNVPDGHTS